MEPRIHLVDPAPAYCAACYQPKPDVRHVDFGASTDGAALPPALQNTVGVVAHTIDEVVICEVCITQAAALIGLGDVKKHQDALAVSEARNDQLHAQLEETRSAVTDALDDARKRITGAATPPPASPNSSIPFPGVKQRAKKRPARR